MSAPVADRPPVTTAPRRTAVPRRAAVPAQRGADRAARFRPDGPDTAASRAYARREERVRRSTGAPRPASAEPTRRAQFVLLVMGLLVAGLVLTLGLSTAAAADSYRLQAAREQAATLTEQVEALRRSVAIAGSPTELARRAGEQGMVPAGDAARLVVAPDGSVTVVGDPSPVPAPPPPVAPPAPVVPPVPGAAEPGTADPGAVAPGEVDAGAAVPGATDPAAVPGPATEDAAVAADGALPDPAPDPAADPAAADPATGTAATDPAAGAGAGAATDPAATGAG